MLELYVMGARTAVNNGYTRYVPATNVKSSQVKSSQTNVAMTEGDDYNGRARGPDQRHQHRQRRSARHHARH